MGATDDVAAYICSTDDLTGRDRVIDVVEQALVDTVGVALSASTTPFADSLLRGLAAEPGRHRVIGRAELLSATGATLANGSLIHAEDWDDMGGCGGHPSAALFPALFAVAETTTVSGRQLVDAYAVGYQVGTVLHRYVTSDTQGLDRPWHPSGVVGPVAAAAAAARLMGLPHHQARDAIAIAASFAGGFRAQFGTDTKALHLGKAAMAGHLAASLARSGVTGDAEVLERRNGFGACFAPTASWRYMAHDLTGSLFITSQHERNTVGFGIAAKPWPWCGGAISAVTALEAALAEGAVLVDDVDAVIVEESIDRASGSMFRSPYTGVGTHGRFSLPYNLAARLVFSDVGPHVHSDEAAKEVLASGLLPRIDIRVGPFAEPEPPVSRVTIHLRDGRSLVGESFRPRHRTGWDMLTQKFRQTTAAVLAVDDADALLDRLRDLHDAHDAGSLLADINDVTTVPSHD